MDDTFKNREPSRTEASVPSAEAGSAGAQRPNAVAAIRSKASSLYIAIPPKFVKYLISIPKSFHHCKYFGTFLPFAPKQSRRGGCSHQPLRLVGSECKVNKRVIAGADDISGGEEQKHQAGDVFHRLGGTQPSQFFLHESDDGGGANGAQHQDLLHEGLRRRLQPCTVRNPLPEFPGNSAASVHPRKTFPAGTADSFRTKLPHPRMQSAVEQSRGSRIRI